MDGRHPVGGHDADGGEQRQRDRQIEMGAFLGQVRGGEVDRDPFGRQRDGHRLERGADPFAGLGHGLVRQADDGEARQAGRDGALNLDPARVQPFEGHRMAERDAFGAGPVKHAGDQP
jgi:hypothetical protein